MSAVMRLAAISVGKMRSLQISGQNITTAYLKEQVHDPVRIHFSGVEGNDVAVHTDAIYAVGREHYDFWAQRLGKSSRDWPFGFFAENFTIEGLDESELRVGDRLRVGESVELLVAGPRVPCFKLAWRMGQPESFISEFALSGRTGVYFSVASEGVVNAGDEVRVIAKADHPTVSDVAAMIFGPTDTDVATLRSLLAAPSISQTVSLGLRNRLYRTLDTLQTQAHRWAGWRDFRIEKVVDETPNIKSFYLQAADRRELPRFRAGQFLTVRVPVSEDQTVQRTWSLSDYTEDVSTYRLTIKKEPEGVASRWMHEYAKAGTLLQVGAPNGRFNLDRGSFKPAILIGAGVGITPLLAMVKAHLARGPSAPLMYLVYCARSRAERAFRAELDAIPADTSIRVLYVSSAPSSGEKLDIDHQIAGRLRFDDFARFVSDAHINHGGKRIDLPWYDCDVYLCGPQKFQRELLASMAAQGADPSRVRTEAFCLVPGEQGFAVSSARVVLNRDGRELTWTAGCNETLLELLDRHGVSVPNNCRMGLCESCRCGLVEGKVAYDPQPPYPPAKAVLLCCARPNSEMIRLDI